MEKVILEDDIDGLKPNRKEVYQSQLDAQSDDYILENINIHINNGGIDLSIKKEEFVLNDGTKHCIPLLNIKANHFGYKTNDMDIKLTPDRMKSLGDWLIRESKNAEKYYINENHGEDSFDGIYSKFELRVNKEQLK